MKIQEVNLNIFYGYMCNYSCQGCFSGSDVITTYDKDPDLEKIKQSIKRASEIIDVTNMVTLIGGEPFLYWDSRIVPLAIEINKYFPKKRINITTNGQLLGKNVEKLFAISKSLDEVSFTITRHLAGIDDQKVKRLWEKNMQDFLSHPMIVRVHDDHYHVKDNIHANIYFYDTETWKSYYYHTSDQRIKPWRTNDPKNSMLYGCPGPVCSCLYENKLYKCTNLATLTRHLEQLNQLDDPDWQKYLDYPYLDINDINDDLLAEFIKTYGKPTTYCDMCSNKPQNNIPWTSRTFSMVFSRAQNF